MNAIAGGQLPLRDIWVPTEPSWWPPAPGWWVLALLLVGLLAWTSLRGRRAWLQRRRRLRIRRQLETELANAMTPEQQLRCAATFLRRWALANGSAAATVRGEAWLEHLDGNDPARPFSQGAGRLLLDGPYRKHVEASEVSGLLALIKRRVFDAQP